MGRAARTLTACVVVAASCAPPVDAATFTYRGNSPFNANWTDGLNWDPFVLGGPANGSTILIHPISLSSWDPVVDVPWSVEGVSFSQNADLQSVSMTGSTLTVGAGGVNNNGWLSHTVHNNIVMSADQEWFTNPDGKLTIEGSISGGHDLTKTSTGSLYFHSSNGYTGTTTVDDGTLFLRENGRLADASPLVVNSGGTFDTTEPDAVWSLDGAGNVELQSGSLLAVGNFGNAGGTGTFSGVINGSGVLSKRGNGTLTLSGANTSTGLTEVREGTLVAASNGALGAGGNFARRTTVDDGATLAFSSSADIANEHVTVEGNGDGGLGALRNISGFSSLGGPVTLAADSRVRVDAGGLTVNGVIGGSGGLEKTGIGTLELTASNTYGGATVVNGGVLKLSGGGQLPDATNLTIVPGATFDTAVVDTITNLNGGGTVNFSWAGAVLEVMGTGTFSGPMTGTGGLTKSGSGTLNLTTSKAYTGATTVNGGTLSLNGNGRLSNSSALIVNSGGTFHTTEPDAIWSLNGNGTVDIESPGALVVGNFGNAGGSGFFSGLIEGNGVLAKRGSGTLRLTGANTYTGETQVDEGTLRVEHGSALGAGGSFARRTTVDPGATLHLTHNTHVSTEHLTLSGDGQGGVGALSNTGTSSWGGPVTLAADSRIRAGSGTLTVSGIISGSGGLEKTGTGTLQLTGTNTFAGGLTIQEGQLNVDSFSLSPNKDILNNGILQLDHTAAGTYSGSVSGSGSFVKEGVATLGIDDVNTYTGATTINNGGIEVLSGGSLDGTASIQMQPGTSLSLDNGGTIDTGMLDFSSASFTMTGGRLTADNVVGNLVVGGGTLAPGDSPGITAITGNYDQASAASLEIEIASAGGVAGTDHDQVTVSGGATLDGSLEVDLLGGFLPTLGETFEVMTYASVTGEFASSTGLDAATGLFLAPTYGATSLILEAVYAGDVNRDGKVDGLDANVVAANFLSSGVGFENGDANLDGTVNGLDANVIAGNFLAGVPAHSIPEPSGMVLAGLGLLFVAARRRRRA